LLDFTARLGRRLVAFGRCTGDVETFVAAPALAAYVTEKTVELVAWPRGVVTAIFPVFAPWGTAVTSLVALSRVILALVSSKLTAVAPDRLMPFTVTVVPGLPVVGEKLSIVGVVERITAPPPPVEPTPQQSVLVGHDTPLRPPSPLGRTWDRQVMPPLVVATTAAPPVEVPPTARQSALVGHETPSR
jgi:hypothetical protein